MGRYVEIAIVCLGVLAMSEACNDTKENVAPPASSEDVVRFALDAPSTSTRASRASRAMSTATEDEIATADVLVFDAEGLVTRRGAALVSGTTYEASLPRGTYDLMVVANASGATSELVPRTSRADVLRQMTVSREGKWDYSTPIPMWGHADAAVLDEGATIHVDMYRMLARIDLKLAAAVTNFELRAIWLANENSVGQVAPNYLDAAVWDPTGGVVNPGRGVAVAPSLPSSTGRAAGLSQEFEAADGVTVREAVRVIYTFEAAAGADAAGSGAGAGSGSDAGGNPCLVVGGSYSGGATTWYRVDFAVPSAGELEYFPLLRNHDYVITVRSVSGPGLSTPEAALSAVSSPMTVGVGEWMDGEIGPIDL